MKDPFTRFAGIAALLAGISSILYAIFFLVVTPSVEYLGSLASWILLAVGGAFGGAVYVALYQRTRVVSEGFALWGMLIGSAASGATMANGVFKALLISGQQGPGAPPVNPSESLLFLSQVDPRGLSTFLVFGLASFIFGWLLTRVGTQPPPTPRRRATDTPPLPRNIGYIGMINAILLVVLFLSFVFSLDVLVLVSGGLSSLVMTPLWWIWIARSLLSEDGRS